MGLDRWLKSEKEEKRDKKAKVVSNQNLKNKSEDVTKKPLKKPLIQLKKYLLTCPNTKCKYQKTVMKRKLTDDDLTCPRCKKKMRIKEV